MTNLITEIGRKVFKKNETLTTSGKVELIKARKLMLTGLIECFKRGMTIGIYSNVLGEGMFVTGIHDIYDYDEEPIIMLKRYDLNGSLLIRETLSLNEIQSICIFDTAYKHPILD